MSADRNRRTVLRFFDAYNERDYATLADCLADGLVSHDVPDELGPGREALMEFLRMSFAAFPDLRNVVLAIVAEGDLIAVRAKVTGTHHGEFMGIPTSGNTLEFEDSHFFRCDNDGRIVEHWNYFDNLTVLQQLGVSPEDAG